MSNLFRLHGELLNDNRITDDEVATIRNYMEERRPVGLNDVKFLVGLVSSAREVCSAFDDIFLPILKKVLLADGEIGWDEQYYLLKMLYSKAGARPRTAIPAGAAEELEEVPPGIGEAVRGDCASRAGGSGLEPRPPRGIRPTLPKTATHSSAMSSPSGGVSGTCDEGPGGRG